ncbi:ATP-binding protein [Pullulanibacillus pueri]|nr:ATP-binding protein [Pullulanibacillus pueri]
MSFIIILFLMFITGLRLTWLNVQKQDALPEIVDGTLNLKEFQVSDHHTIPLNGEWAFFPNQFIHNDKEHTNSKGLKKMFLKVPGDWNNAFKKRNSNFKYGTYRLTILLGKNKDQTFKLRIININRASTLYVNGRPIKGAGNPSTQSKTYQARNLPYTVTIPSGHDKMTIDIQVSNQTGEGGITEPIRLGTPKAINYWGTLSTSMQVALCIIFFIHGLYAIMLYCFGIRNKGLIYFSLLIFSAVLSVLVEDDKLLFVWLPMSYPLSMRITFLSYISVVAFIPLILKQLYPDFKDQKLIHWFSVYCLAEVLFILFAPVQMILLIKKELLLVLWFSIFISVYILKKASIKRDDSIFLILGVSSIGVNIFWSIWKFNAYSYESVYYPFDLMIAVFCFAGFWFKRYVRTNNQTKRIAERLQKVNQQKDDFLVNTSHELRNPLHGIMNITQNVLENKNGELSKEYTEKLKVQLTVAKRMALLLDDLIDVTRLQEKTIQLHIKNVKVQSIVGSIFEMLQYMLEGKPITLSINIPEDFPAVKADEKRLIQIMFNLLHNAVKFTDEGEISVSAEVINETAHIHIMDTGIGMDSEMQSKIFLPYEQADSNRTKVVGGFGLGLSICKQYVELHGGTLNVKSTPGEGSLFTFTLSLSEDAEQETENYDLKKSAKKSVAVSKELEMAPAQITSTFEKKPSLLVVDDDPLNQQVLINVFDPKYYEILAVSSANQAIDRIDSKHFDLVISDVMMPNISGYELTRKIRERFSISELPILLLTARNRLEDIGVGFQAGANDYVAKPVDSWELKARVNALIQLKQSIEEHQRIEAAWLQAQIKPHFLYNTMNSIAALGTMDIEKMQRLIEEFSHYLRMSYDFHNSDRMVPIDRELALVRSYLFIEKERFGERINVEWNVDPNLHFLLPPLIIQPLVENAVKHGVLKTTQGGTINICIENGLKEIKISIKDSGVGMTREVLQRIQEKSFNKDGGIGLQNTNRRLKQFYGKGLEVRSIPNQGTTVSFCIPNKE